MPHASEVFQEVSSLLICMKCIQRRWFGAIGFVILFAAPIAFSGCTSQPEVGSDKPKQETIPMVDTSTSLVPEDIPLKITLPNGEELATREGSMEAMLVTFIQDPNTQPGKDNWFNFNDLNFEFGTDKILPESMGEVDNIVRILKAYPKVKIKIGGYTDKLEDEATNLKISTKRAKAVYEALKKKGVGDQLEGAEGYGSQFAQHPATASEEERKKDRRISISIRAK
jgi:outer membrane protein OmpA-like peptidoglycan-associated protein